MIVQGTNGLMSYKIKQKLLRFSFHFNALIFKQFNGHVKYLHSDDGTGIKSFGPFLFKEDTHDVYRVLILHFKMELWREGINV